MKLVSSSIVALVFVVKYVNNLRYAARVLTRDITTTLKCDTATGSGR